MSVGCFDPLIIALSAFATAVVVVSSRLPSAWALRPFSSCSIAAE